MSFDQEPTLEMQSNPRYVTDEQRPALDVYKSLNEQCRNNIATGKSPCVADYGTDSTLSG